MEMLFVFVVIYLILCFSEKSDFDRMKEIEKMNQKSCDNPCSPSDYYKGGKCDKMGCYK